MASLKDPVPAPARAGRRKDGAKREAILAAARDLFFARGIDATTIEVIAAAAGVSKVTVYGHFGDKPTLFEACVRNEASRMEQAFLLSRPRGNSLPECLHAMGVPLLHFLFSDEIVAFDRTLAAEASNHPALVDRFFAAGPYYCCDKLAEMIAAGQERGEVAVDDPRRAAEDLVALWQGILPKELAMSHLPAPTHAEIDARVRRGVNIFMRAYAPSRVK